MADGLGEADGEKLIAAASAWLVALDAGTADRADFEDWRCDPRHAVAFAEVARSWNVIDRLRPLRAPEHAIDKPAIDERLSRRTLLRGAIAAAVVASVGVTAWPWLDEASAETGIGERRTVRLPGGDLVELNTRTRIRWRRTGDPRRLRLDHGEIALALAGDTPFTLTGAHDVRLGHGGVNVRREGAALVITSTADGIMVGAQQLVTGATAQVIDGAMSVTPPRSIVLDRARGWQRGEVVFAGETLASVIAEYNRYLVRPLVVADPSLGTIRLGGRFASTDPRPFLAALAMSFDLAARDDGRGPIVIERESRSPE